MDEISFFPKYLFIYSNPLRACVLISSEVDAAYVNHTKHYLHKIFLVVQKKLAMHGKRGPTHL